MKENIFLLCALSVQITFSEAKTRQCELYTMVSNVIFQCCHFHDMKYTVNVYKERLGVTDAEVAEAFYGTINAIKGADEESEFHRCGCLDWFNTYATEEQSLRIKEIALKKGGRIGRHAVEHYLMRTLGKDESLEFARNVIKNNPQLKNEVWRQLSIQLGHNKNLDSVQRARILAFAEEMSTDVENAWMSDRLLCEYSKGYSTSTKRKRTLSMMLETTGKLPSKVREDFEKSRQKLLEKQK